MKGTWSERKTKYAIALYVYRQWPDPIRSDRQLDGKCILFDW